jgi:two-component system response regulator HydG
VVSIHLPPLRERREDIPLLVEHFLKRYSRKNNKEVSGVSPEVMGAFMEYRWPGNVRELENVIERAVILCTSDTISLDLIPENIRNFQATLVEEALSQNMTLEDLEKEYIKRLLKRIDNKEKVAKILGIDKATLWRKRERYGLK